MSLMNFAQIKGGKQLQANVQSLLTSYEAAKVLTTIVKTPASEDGSVKAVNYNVDELLKSLKDSIAAITGDSEGTTSLKTLKEALDSISGKKVKDIVRLELSVADGKATIPTDLATTVPSVDTSKALPVYTTDNEVLLNENGEQLTINLTDGTFNGTPSVIDEAASAKKTDGSFVYKPVTLTSIKIFPQGEWTLKDLPAEALLDNSEMQLIAYKQAINKIVVELAKDSDLIEAVKAQIGTQAVSDQLKEVTASLQANIDKKANITDVYSVDDAGTKTALYRKNADKIKLADLDQDLQDVIKTAATPQVFDPSDLIAEDAKKFDKANIVKSTDDTSAEGYVPSDDKVLSEKAARAAIDSIKTNIEASAEKAVEDSIAVTAPTTTFTLTKKPNDRKVKMIINHLVYNETEDFTVDRATKTITWTATEANNGFDIDTDLTDKVDIVYYTKEA